MHNHFQIDYIAYNSHIRNWNAGYKLLFMAASIITVIIADNVLVSVYTLVFMGFINIFIARLSPKEYLKVMKIPAAFILLGSIAIGICFSSTPKGIFSLDIGFTYLCLTKENTSQMFSIILKAFGAVSAMYVVTLSTPVCEIIAELKKLHIPGIFIELMYLIYRYIFILFDAVHKMQDSGKSRLGYTSFKASCRSFSMMLGNLLIISLKNSRNYYNAMEARCYNGQLEFYTEKKALTRPQAILTLIYFIFFIIIKVCL